MMIELLAKGLNYKQGVCIATKVIFNKSKVGWITCKGVVIHKQVGWITIIRVELQARGLNYKQGGWITSKRIVLHARRVHCKQVNELKLDWIILDWINEF